jgi:hypothetical protein
MAAPKAGANPQRNSIDDCTPEEWYKVPRTPLDYVAQEQDFADVHHPKHYAEGRKYEPWDVIEDWGLNYFAATALKYISRYERKGEPVKDLRKAIAFLERELERLTKET